VTERYRDSTRAVAAVNSDAVAGRPVSHVPVPASTFHLSPDEGSEPDTYGRNCNPTRRVLESALARLKAPRPH
jgi:cystathionine gamma-lyase